jgi:selenocysteine lyase/cysteine desulfurase
MNDPMTSEHVTLTQFESEFNQKHPTYSTTYILDEFRAKEFKRLDKEDLVYLDYTGGNLYSEQQITKHAHYLLSGVYGNPHSQNSTSERSSCQIDETRRSLLNFFNAGDDYFIIFTPNASGALKIIGECYPFHDRGHFLLPFDNHNSVNGIREYAHKSGAGVTYSPLCIHDLRIDSHSLEGFLSSFKDKTNKLFAYPAQSNVSGVKHSLNWIKVAQDQGWDVLLDASAFVPANTLDLQKVTPDFVSMSFYKMFGYPTGLGCLLIRKTSFDKLVKPWFAGGTVTLASAMTENFSLARDHSKFEDGTLNYLDIPALKLGINLLKEMGMETINRRVTLLTKELIEQLRQLKHSNEAPLVNILGPKDFKDRGGTIIFNFLNPDGSVQPYLDVETEANKRNISIRTGCFCNPGIDELTNHLQAGQLDQFFKAHPDGTVMEMMDHLHTMRGAIRVSVGYVTNLRDIYRFLEFVRSFRN